MDVIRVFQVLVRRWAVVVPVLLLGFAGTAYAASTIPPEYTASGSLIVLDRSGGAGEVTPEILAEALQDGATRERVSAESGSSVYEVTASGGILRVSGGGTDVEQAAATANAVLSQIEGIVSARQAASGGAASTATVEILNQATSSSVTRDEEGRLRATASARLVGGGTAIGGDRASRLLTAALDGSSVREAVGAAGGNTEYSVSTARDLPTISISVVDVSSGGATRTIDLVAAQAQDQLTELLALQDASTTVVVERLEASGGVVVDDTGVLRSVVALLALTAGAAVAIAFAVEAVAEHRRRTRRPQSAGVLGEPEASSLASAPLEAPRESDTAKRSRGSVVRHARRSSTSPQPASTAPRDDHEGVTGPHSSEASALVDDDERQPPERDPAPEHERDVDPFTGIGARTH